MMSDIAARPGSVDAYRLLHNGILALSRAERAGMRIDLDYCDKMEKELTKRITALEESFKSSKLYRHWAHCSRTPPNINSGDQLGNFLYNTKKIKPARLTETGKGGTDEESLAALNIPELNDLLTARKLKKVRDTYLNAFIREQVNGMIHPFFNLHTVRTFRSSSDSPNFQNIPKRDKEAMAICRRAIYPRKGHLLMEADFSAVEVRVSACYHKDPTMMKYILDPTTDMHGDMAAQLYIIPDLDKKTGPHKHLRQAAKNGFVFPQFYGDYYKNCAISLACSWGKLPEGKWKSGQGVEAYPGTHLSDHFATHGIRSLDDFMEHVREIEKDFWYKRFPVYTKWKERHWAAYQKNGYVDILTGFRCIGLMSRNDAINYPVQGAAFHCLLWAFTEMDRIFQERNLDTKLVGQIHDAIILDIHPDELEEVAGVVHQVMCEDIRKAFPWLVVPLDIEADVTDVDGSWADMKPFKFKSN